MNDNTTSSPSVKNLAKLFESKNISPPNIRRSVGVSLEASSKICIPEQDLPKKKSHDGHESRCMNRSPLAGIHQSGGKIFSFSQFSNDSDNEFESQIDDEICETEIQTSFAATESRNVGKVLQNDEDSLHSTPLQNNKVVMQQSITPSDEVINNRRQMIIIGLKEHLSSRKMKESSESFTWHDEDAENECNGTVDKKEEEFCHNEDGSSNVTTLKVSINKLKSVQKDDCYIDSNNKTNSNNKPKETSKDDDLFTISRSSIENIETSNDKSESHYDSSTLMRIVNHCQSAVDKLTPKRSKYEIDNDHSISTKMEQVTPVWVNDKSSSRIEIMNEHSKTRKFDFCCREIPNLQIKKYVKLLLENSSRAKQYCMKYFFRVKQMTPIVKIVVKSTTKTSKETLLATTSLLFSMIASLYPTTPRFNCGVSMFLLFVNTIIVSENSIVFELKCCIVINM